MRGSPPRYPPELKSEVAQLLRLSDETLFSPSLGDGSHKAHAARVLVRREFKEAIDTSAQRRGHTAQLPVRLPLLLLLRQVVFPLWRICSPPVPRILHERAREMGQDRRSPLLRLVGAWRRDEAYTRFRYPRG